MFVLGTKTASPQQPCSFGAKDLGCWGTSIEQCQCSACFFSGLEKVLLLSLSPVDLVFFSAAPACKDRCLVSQVWIAFALQVLISLSSGHGQGHGKQPFPEGFQLLLNCRELGAVPSLCRCLSERELLLSPPTGLALGAKRQVTCKPVLLNLEAALQRPHGMGFHKPVCSRAAHEAAATS